MLGEDDEAIRILCASESEHFSQRLRAAIEKATAKFPNAPASVEMDRRRRKKAKVNKRRPGELEAIRTLVFIANCRVEFNDRHSAFKLALRLLRRVALEVRSHAAELKTSLAVLLGAALHETITQHEVAIVIDKVELVQNSSELASVQSYSPQAAPCGSAPETSQNYERILLRSAGKSSTSHPTHS